LAVVLAAPEPLPQQPLPQPQVSQQSQQSEQLRWNKPFNLPNSRWHRLSQHGSQQSQQLGAQQLLELQVGALHVEAQQVGAQHVEAQQVEAPQLSQQSQESQQLRWNMPFSLPNSRWHVLSQHGSQQSQLEQQLPQLPQLEPHDAVAAGAGVAGLAGAFASAPANQAVVTNKNAAFTSDPPYGIGFGRWPRPLGRGLSTLEGRRPAVTDVPSFFSLASARALARRGSLRWLCPFISATAPPAL
jgi:hypothetical protein